MSIIKMHLLKISKLLVFSLILIIASLTQSRSGDSSQNVRYLFNNITSSKMVGGGSNFVIEKGKLKNNKTFMRFSGVLTSKNAFLIEKYYHKIKPNYLALAGPGGMMIPSFKLGKMIHNDKINVVILPNDYCLSACFYAALGSKSLLIYGLGGLHMPYFDKLSMDDTLSNYNVELTMTIWKAVLYMEKYGKFDQNVIGDVIDNTTASRFAVIQSNTELSTLQNKDATGVSMNFLDGRNITNYSWRSQK